MAQSKKTTTKRSATKSTPKTRAGGANGAAKRAPSTAPKKKPARGLVDLAARMRGIDLCMMTTQGEDGLLHTRPMSNNGKVDFDGDAWFFSGRETPKVTELEADDRVSLSYVGGTKREPVWIALEGTAEIVDDVDKKRELWVKELDRWFENGPDDENVVLIHVEGARATWWSGEKQGQVSLR